MQQHPLPQNVTTYQFHLIGSMTLKQFLYLVIGIGVAWFIYSLPLLDIIKWTLMGISILTGIAFSFIPYQDRPLDHWFLTFMRSIYSPTQFTWKKHPQTPAFLQSTTGTKVVLPQEKTTPTNKNSLTSYLQSLPQTELLNPLDNKEIQSVAAITQLFGQVVPSIPPSTTPIPAPVPTKSVKVVVRKLKTPPPNYAFTNQAETSPTSTPIATSSPTAINTTITTITTPTTHTINPHKTVTATTNIKLPFPQTPTVPNVIVGMTLDQKRNILDNTIIEIRDSKNNPARALKSNKLGQFFIATTLPNGAYEIEAEKPGFAFETIKMALTGQIIPPLELRAKPSSSMSSSVSKPYTLSTTPSSTPRLQPLNTSSSPQFATTI